MGILKDGIGTAVTSALDGLDTIEHEVQGPEGRAGISHEVTGRAGEAVRHEVVGEDTPVIRHMVAEVGQLRLTADPVAVQVPPVMVRVGVEALSRLRVRVPAQFSVRLTLFGREVARLDLAGTARLESDPE